jgi:bifunctional DNA-binding transcriptional regulator/antitoxin component of YhaV-PrlF toxin-antitoxin module
VIPPEEVKELGWKEGDELEPKRQGKTLVLKEKGKTS